MESGFDKFKNSAAEASMKRTGEEMMMKAREEHERKRKEGKLPWEEWVPKYFEKDRGTYTSIYERVEEGLAPSDLSVYTLEDLEDTYQEYLDDTSDFLKYKE